MRSLTFFVSPTTTPLLTLPLTPPPCYRPWKVRGWALHFPLFFFLSFSLSRKWEKTRKEEIISQTHQWKKSKELLNWTPSMTMKLPTPLTSATMTTADKRSCTQSIKGGSNLYYFTYSNKTISNGTYPFWVYPSTKTRLSTLWLMKLWDYLRDMKARNKATRLMTGRVGVGVWCGRGMSTSAMK